jgi:hypothetical protein
LTLLRFAIIFCTSLIAVDVLLGVDGMEICFRIRSVCSLARFHSEGAIEDLLDEEGESVGFFTVAVRTTRLKAFIRSLYLEALSVGADGVPNSELIRLGEYVLT